MTNPYQTYTEATAVSERNQLLMEHLPQVRYIARRIYDRLPKHVCFEDLVQAGVLGLFDAIEKFDCSRNVQFQSYAKFRIRGAILDSLRELDWATRDLRRKSRKIEEAVARISGELGREPTEQEVAEALGVDLAELQRLLTELDGLDLSSLQTAEDDGDGKGYDLLGSIPADPDESPFSIYMRSELKDVVARAIEGLPEKERQVLALYYYEELTMKEVGLVLGVGESRVSQIHSMALVRLRAQLNDSLRIAATVVPPETSRRTPKASA